MARKKPILHDTDQCRGVGVFCVKYDDDNTPWLQCDHCGKIIDDWRRWRDTYSTYWDMAEKWNSKRDHLMCLLGYFANLYQRHYGVPFTFSLNERGLFNGKEVFCIRKTYSLLGNDAFLAKEYIDWIFARKVVRKNKQITSMSFLAVPELIQEFKLYRQKLKRITRDRPIPEKMILWIKENTAEVLNHVSLRDFGELRMALSAYGSGHFNDVPDFEKFVNRLKQNNIIDNALNIVGWSD